MNTNRRQQLLARKAKLEAQLNIETEKRLKIIARLAEQENLLDWSDQALKKAFQTIAKQGEKAYQTAQKEEVPA